MRKIGWLFPEGDLIGRHSGGCVRGGIVGPCSPYQEAAPCRWLLVNEGSEVLFDHTVHDLHLTVRLRVVRSAHLECRPTKLEQLLPEMANEKRIPIGDKDSRWAMYLAGNFHE